MTNYFYARVSTKDQNVDRQLTEFKNLQIPDANVFIDYESGKDFDREQWKRLTETIDSGDVLFVMSIDRLGRNYKEILNVWTELTRNKNVDVVVLDMPLIDTRREKTLLGTFIADLVLQVLSFVAENERSNLLKRQKQGIASARLRGVKFGRPTVRLPETFEQFATDYNAGKITLENASKALNMTMSTFRVYAKKIGPKLASLRPPGKGRDPIDLGPEFESSALAWFNGEVTAKQEARKYKIRKETFSIRAKQLFPNMERKRPKKARKRPEHSRKRLVKKITTNGLPGNFRVNARCYLRREMSLEHACLYCGMNPKRFLENVEKYKSILEN